MDIGADNRPVNYHPSADQYAFINFRIQDRGAADAGVFLNGGTDYFGVFDNTVFADESFVEGGVLNKGFLADLIFVVEQDNRYEQGVGSDFGWNMREGSPLFKKGGYVEAFEVNHHLAPFGILNCCFDFRQ